MGKEPAGNKAEPLLSDPYGDSMRLEGRAVPPPPPATIPSTDSLPPGWEAAISSENGRTYYWEKSTGKTSWTHPSAFPSPQSTVVPAASRSPGTFAEPVNAPSADQRSHIIQAPSPVEETVTSQPSVKGQNSVPGLPSSTTKVSPATRANLTSTFSADSGHSGIMEARSMKSSKSYDSSPGQPRSQQFLSVLATILFFPLGLFALIHSFKVENAWDAGRHRDSVRHSRRALLFSRLAIAFGAIFWIWFIFFRGPGGFIFDFRPLFDWW